MYFITYVYALQYFFNVQYLFISPRMAPVGILLQILILIPNTQLSEQLSVQSVFLSDTTNPPLTFISRNQLFPD